MRVVCVEGVVVASVAEFEFEDDLDVVEGLGVGGVHGSEHRGLVKYVHGASWKCAV